MYVRCGGNMRDTDDGRTTDRPSLLYGKIFWHSAEIGWYKNSLNKLSMAKWWTKIHSEEENR